MHTNGLPGPSSLGFSSSFDRGGLAGGVGGGVCMHAHGSLHGRGGFSISLRGPLLLPSLPPFFRPGPM